MKSEIYLVSRVKYFSDQTDEAYVFLPEEADTPTIVPEMATFTSAEYYVTSPSNIDSMEIEVGPGTDVIPLEMPYVIASNWVTVKQKPLSDNFARAEALAVVGATGDDGLLLQVIGAFKEYPKSAFFWG